MTKTIALIVNPAAGRGLSAESCEPMLSRLRGRGLEVRVYLTTPEPFSAKDLAQRAAHQSDWVVACGGDGTVHEVLQGVAGTSTHLGVLPFGTENALARNLGLPRDPMLALEALLQFKPINIPLARIETAEDARYFTVMAGAGPDGGLVYDLSREKKARLGRKAYSLTAARHFLSRRFPSFEVEYRCAGTEVWHKQIATAIMISRVPDLGGIFQGLTRASWLQQPYLVLQMLGAPAHLALTAWFGFSRLHLEKYNPLLSTVQVEECRIAPLEETSVVHCQADGEALGPIPAHVRLSATEVSLLMRVSPPDMKSKTGT